MSLVGNLEDLSLGDIMQIISMSQKSGVSALEGGQGSGRIVFQSGLVHAACLKGRPDDLRGLLVGSGRVEGPAFDEFAERARELGLPVEETIAQEGGLTSEQIDVLLRESVEAAILEMFSWPSGEFCFDVRSNHEPDDPRLQLSSGINAQYLAMEGMRILDERSREECDAPVNPGASASTVDSFPSADDMFGDEPLETGELLSDDDSSPADIVVETVISRVDEQPESGIALAKPDPVDATETSEEARPTAALKSPATRKTPVVLIYPDVSVLEWVNTTIQDDFARVHVFQEAEQGLTRIRQYLIRGELPVVLISTGIRIDPLSGIHGLSDFVGRLKKQAAKLVVVGLYEDDEAGAPVTQAAFDGLLVQPNRKRLRERHDSVTSNTALEFASALHRILADRSEVRGASVEGSSVTKATSARNLRDVAGKLQLASSRGEVLPVVLEFASQLFARVAILIVREDQVFAIAGHGIEALEVDPLDSAPPVSLQVLGAGWVQKVLQSGRPFQGPPITPADEELLARLGGTKPNAAYVGPIGSGGSTIALLYGDQAPDGAAMPDTSGLEEVLHHAGLALDRAALERALWEADAEQG